MDRTVVYALVVGAILIVAFFALWRGTGGDNVATPTSAPPSSSSGSGTGSGGSAPTQPATPPAK